MHSSNLKWYIVILLLVLILGFLIFLSTNRALTGKDSGGATVQKSVSGDFSLFDTVNAAVTGKITKVENKIIFFENQKGARGEAVVADGVAISDLSKTELGTPSADLKRIELNKTANMIFNLQGEKFSVISITYPQP